MLAAAAIYKGTTFGLAISLYMIDYIDPLNYFYNIEMYGNPDGTIPATFQILYMVRDNYVRTCFYRY
jgi:hypothetical protein